MGERQRARKGHRRLVVYPPKLAYVRLAAEARKRRTTAARLLTQLLELLDTENLYSAVIDD
jgi:hypothetical protein